MLDAPQKKIPMLDLAAQNGPLRADIEGAIARVLDGNRFILGPEVEALEREIAEYLGVPHAIGVSSGTDALLISLMALGVDASNMWKNVVSHEADEIITTPFTFFATAGSIVRSGAKPVFVDIDPVTFNLDATHVADAVTPRTRALMPVHLFGQPCDMRAIREAAGDLPIVEDAAQALGARCCEGIVGGLGTLAAFSFFPSKNLGGFGDGGLVTTSNAELAEQVRVLRAHGSKPKYYHSLVGGNFRLDALQAAILRAKLPYLERWTEGRRRNAALYDEFFANSGLPPERLIAPKRVHEGHVYNQYVIRTDRRDALKAHLAQAGIATAIYYPLPLHLQPCFEALACPLGSFPESERAAREVLALPIFGELETDGVERIASEIVSFLR